MVQAAQGNTPALEQELEQMAQRKFKFCVSMQRYAKFNKEEMENVEFLLHAYPDLQIACLEEEPAKDKNGETWIFSALIDGHSEANSETGKRKPKFRIELPGNLILGRTTRIMLSFSTVASSCSSSMRTKTITSKNVSRSATCSESSKCTTCLVRIPYAQWGVKEFSNAPVAILGPASTSSPRTLPSETSRNSIRSNIMLSRLSLP